MIYRYIFNLDTLEFKIECYEYEEDRYINYSTYVLKKKYYVIFDRNLRKFEPHKNRNYLSCYSFDNNRMGEFKRLCIEKLEQYCKPKESKKYDYKDILDKLKNKEKE